MDLTPLIPAGRQVIESYGSPGFRVTGVLHRGSVIVFPDATLAWPVRELAEVTIGSLAPVTGRGGVEILLLGCGVRMQPVAPELRRALKEAGIVVDAMDTGAACRTYNVLMAEDRHVAAALLSLAVA
ncbi:MAG TPA: Mth938-like domain-containing protein [Stellaceae bacterium]|nr:Mth938-like domain-containing protein [Stellaceae bacterium]